MYNYLSLILQGTLGLVSVHFSVLMTGLLINQSNQQITDHTLGVTCIVAFGLLWIELPLYHYRDVWMYRDATSSHPYTVFSVILWWSFIRRAPNA